MVVVVGVAVIVVLTVGQDNDGLTTWKQELLVVVVNVGLISKGSEAGERHVWGMEFHGTGNLERSVGKRSSNKGHPKFFCRL